MATPRKKKKLPIFKKDSQERHIRNNSLLFVGHKCSLSNWKGHYASLGRNGGESDWKIVSRVQQDRKIDAGYLSKLDKFLPNSQVRVQSGTTRRFPDFPDFQQGEPGVQRGPLLERSSSWSGCFGQQVPSQRDPNQVHLKKRNVFLVGVPKHSNFTTIENCWELLFYPTFFSNK